MAEDEDTKAAEPEAKTPEREEKAPRRTAAMLRREHEWHSLPWRFGSAACSACGNVRKVAGHTRAGVRCLDCERRNRPRRHVEAE
jgi:hypothetical protein